MWQLPTFMILLMHYKAFNPRTLKKNYVFDHIDNEESNLLEVSDIDIASVNQEISNPMETVNESMNLTTEHRTSVHSDKSETHDRHKSLSIEVKRRLMETT